MNTVELVIALIFTPTAVVAVVAYFLRSFFQQMLSRDIENFKAKLQAEAEQSKMRMEHELQTRLFEYQTSFPLFHNKQVEVVSEVYSRLADTKEYVASLINPIQYGDVNEPELNLTFDKYQDLAEYYTKNRIYLDEEICVKIDDVLKTMRVALTKWRFAQSHSSERTLDSWQEAWQSINDDVPSVLKELEDQFRRSLRPR